jgi:transmembrane sensor
VASSDIQELEKWRASSAAHAREFAEAALLWTVLGEAARKAEDSRALRASATTRPLTNRHLGRRAFLAGGGAIAASLAGALVVRPPLELWPSFSELAADYRTRTGERQQIAVASHVSVEMNTRTSIDLRSGGDGAAQIELLAGEAAIAKRDDTLRELVVLAGNGRAGATKASFNIRKDGSSVSVTCLAGEVEVQCRAAVAAIREGQQISYDERGLGAIATIDPEVITAWQRGLLIFRRMPLAQVIDEVNRYRSGRIILLDAKLGQRQVVANFRLDRIDDVIAFMSKAMNVSTRSLPGGIVLVG